MDGEHMSDEGAQIAEPRLRCAGVATALGDDTPLETALHMADERALLWRDIINTLGRVSSSGPDDLALPARALRERLHAL
jgi:hypothetical protein